MSAETRVQRKPASPTTSMAPVAKGLLQRRCACGGSAGPEGECAACRTKQLGSAPRLQALSRHGLKVSEPGDPAEKEAERIAPELASSSEVDAPAAWSERLGFDFSRVRMHTDASAARAAGALNARAFTMGRDVYFGAGEYRPETEAGRHLLAHEMVHVAQQGAATPAVQRQEASPEAGAVPEIGAGGADQVVEEIGGDLDWVIEMMRSALEVAGQTLAEGAFDDEKLERIARLADKLRPALENYERVQRGEPIGEGVTLQFDPHRDEIDEGDTEYLLSLGYGDPEEGGGAAAEVFASFRESIPVTLSDPGAIQRDVVCLGLCIGAIILLGGLILSGCSNNKQPSPAKTTTGKKRVTDADGKGWLMVRHPDDSTEPPLPQYLKVDHTSTSAGREKFTILEGRLKNGTASVKEKGSGSSYLSSDLTYKGAATVKFDKAKEELYYGDKGPVSAITDPDNPTPTGTHDLEIPDEPHPGGEHYESDSVFAKTWFRIGHSGDRYLHPGRRSAGCATVNAVSEWTKIYNYLINSRKDDKSVGKIKVT